MTFSQQHWEGGGRGLDYGKNDWKKWNFDSSTMGKMSWKNEKKSEIFRLITWISYEKSIISVVSWNRLCVQKNSKTYILGFWWWFFLQKLKKETFLKVSYMGISTFFQKKKMENQHFLHVFRIHTYADLDIIFHQNQENENILHFMEILTYRSFWISIFLFE